MKKENYSFKDTMLFEFLSTEDAMTYDSAEKVFGIDLSFLIKLFSSNGSYVCRMNDLAYNFGIKKIEYAASTYYFNGKSIKTEYYGGEGPWISFAKDEAIQDWIRKKAYELAKDADEWAYCNGKNLTEKTMNLYIKKRLPHVLEDALNYGIVVYQFDDDDYLLYEEDD